MIDFRRDLSYGKLRFCEWTLTNFCTSARIFSPCENCRRGFLILQTLQNKPNTIADFRAGLIAKSAIPDRQLFRGGFVEVIITSVITTGRDFRG